MTVYCPVCLFGDSGVGFDVGCFDKSTLSDELSLNIGEAMVNSGEMALAENLSITDGVHFQLSLTEVLNVVDSITNSANKVLSEALNVVDSKITSVSKSLAETLNVVDSSVQTVILNLSESIQIADSFVKRMLMVIRKIAVRIRGGNYESDIELED